MGHKVLSAGRWCDQLRRVERYLARVERHAAGVSSWGESYPDDAQDDVFSFFIHCYALADWLKNDPESPVTPSMIDLFVDRSDELKLCADLANGIKHLVLHSNSGRSGACPTQRGRHITHRIGGENPGLSVELRVRVADREIPAIELARRSMQEWRVFLGRTEAS